MIYNDGELCPRCGFDIWDEIECGDDSWDSYSVRLYLCRMCGLCLDDWTDRYLLDVEDCSDREGAEEYKVVKS